MLQGLAVILALVAEQGTVFIDPFAADHQPVEIVVSAFVAEVPLMLRVAG
jgi:hypothetical protein